MAYKDVSNLYDCMTEKMFRTYSEMVDTAWRKDGEQRLTDVFFKSYVSKKEAKGYNIWFCCSSGLAGCIPLNNPQERVNQEIKGTRRFPASCNCGKNITTMLTVELPNMVYKTSLSRVGVERNFKINNRDIVLNYQSNDYQKLLRYFNSFDSSIDIRSNGQNKFFVNTEEYLGSYVTEERTKLYRDALKGKTELDFSQRGRFFSHVESLCMVTRHKKQQDGNWQYTGNCSTFQKDTYCTHAARLMYKQELESLGRSIPQFRTTSRGARSVSSPKRKLIELLRKSASTIFSSMQMVIQDKDQFNSKLSEIISSYPDINEMISTVESLSKPKVEAKTGLAHICVVDALDLHNFIKSNSSTESKKKEALERAVELASKLQRTLVLLEKQK